MAGGRSIQRRGEAGFPCFAGQGSIHLNSLGCKRVDSREAGPAWRCDREMVGNGRRTVAGRDVMLLWYGSAPTGLAAVEVVPRWIPARRVKTHRRASELGIAGRVAGG